MRQEWVPLFEKYTVDLVINGHTHVYERTDVIKGGEVTQQLPIGGTAYPETDGVVYVTAGAAGRSLYAFSADQSYEGHVKDNDAVASPSSASRTAPSRRRPSPGPGCVTSTTPSCAWTSPRPPRAVRPR